MSIVAKRSPISATAELLLLFGVAIADLNVVIFAGQSADQEPLKIANFRRSTGRSQACRFNRHVTSRVDRVTKISTVSISGTSLGISTNDPFTPLRLNWNELDVNGSLVEMPRGVPNGYKGIYTSTLPTLYFATVAEYVANLVNVSMWL